MKKCVSFACLAAMLAILGSSCDRPDGADDVYLTSWITLEYPSVKLVPEDTITLSSESYTSEYVWHRDEWDNNLRMVNKDSIPELYFYAFCTNGDYPVRDFVHQEIISSDDARWGNHTDTLVVYYTRKCIVKQILYNGKDMKNLAKYKENVHIRVE